jgi:uncharacterized protein YutD
MKNIELNGLQYELVENDNECFNFEETKDKATDYFNDFDYIFGDYAYEKLRLKGFNESNNKNVTQINDIKYLEEYRKKYCNYGSKTFLLKKCNK